MELKVNDLKSKEALIAEINAAWGRGDRYMDVKIRYGKQRTLTQSNALHLYCEMLAEALNSAGFEHVIKLGSLELRIPYTKTIVKETIWKPLQEIIVGEIKTSKASRKDYAPVYDALNNSLINCGIHVPWPEKDQ